MKSNQFIAFWFLGAAMYRTNDFPILSSALFGLSWLCFFISIVEAWMNE